MLEPLRDDTAGAGPTWWVAERPESAYRFHLYDAETLIGTVSSFQAAAEGLFWYLNRTIAALPTDLLLLHAAAAADDGRVVICAGRAGSGKSTLVARLVQRGFDYLTDEIAALDSTRSVAPYPKPISLEPGSLPLLPGLELPPVLGTIDPDGTCQVPADVLRAGAVAAGGVATVIVFPDIVEGEGAALLPMTRAEAVEQLALSSFQLPASPGLRLPHIRALAEQVPCFRLRLHDLDDAVDVIHRHLDQPGPRRR